MNTMFSLVRKRMLANILSVVVILALAFPVTGSVYAQAPAPWLIAFPEGDAIEGWEWSEGATVTLAINGFTDPDWIGIANVTTWGDPRTYLRIEFGADYNLQVNDVVTLTDEQGTVISHTVQNLSVTEVDQESNTLKGTANAGAVVQAWPHEHDQEATVETIAGDDGFWQVDFTDLFDLVSGTCGRSQIVIDGSATAVDWCVPWQSSTFIVNTTDDNEDGTCDELHCSLREAINIANSRQVADTIIFNIPGEAPFTIQPHSALPNVDDTVMIDGTTQPGYSGTPVIELDGTSAGEWVTGLVLAASDSTVKGLAVNRFGGDGLGVFGSRNTVRDNYFGTDVTGATTQGAPGPGVGNYTVSVMPETCPIYPIGTDFDGFVSESMDPLAPWSGISVQFVGTDGTEDIPGCGRPETLGEASLIYRYKLEFEESTQLASIAVTGAAFNGPDNILRVLDENKNVLGTAYTFGGNSFQTIYVGLQGVDGKIFYIDEFDTSSTWRFRQNFVINGPAPLGNHGNGVLIAGGATNNTVIKNLISGNMANGVGIFNPGTTGNVVQENYIGTDITGMQALGNAAPGVGIGDQAYNNFIIGNLISGNRSDGVAIFNAGTNGTTLQGNNIGTDASGMGALPNGGVGIWIGEGASDTVIGGIDASLRNVISGNTWGGVGINHIETTGTRVSGNYIGLNKNGDNALPNGGDGVYISGSQSIIGGVEPGAGNVISGNIANGVSMAWGATGNLVQKNYIGTDATGTKVIGSESGPAYGEYAVEIMPESCPVYEPGTERDGFIAEIDDPLAPWSGTSVTFQGTDEDKCGVPETFQDVPLIYRYKLTFSEPTALTSIAVSGAAFNGSILRVLDEDRNVLGTAYNYGGNTFQTSYITLSGVVGQVFYVDEYDYSSDWRYRQNITINGPLPLGNSGSGVNFNNGATNNRVIGNIVSGNRSDAISLYHSGTTGNILQGNYIGTDVSGTVALPNTSAAIWIGEGASNTLIGGVEHGQGNLISGNTGDAISINNAETTGTIIQGNFIGTDVAGTAPIPNQSNGIVLVSGTHDNLIGGTEAGAGNTVAFNHGVGIVYGDAGIGNAVLSNSIFSNRWLGIDLGSDYITYNDPLDQDAGPNNLQNFPVITAVIRMGTSTMIQGLLASTPGTKFRLEFFSNETCDPSGFGEGKTFLGSADVRTNPAGTAHFKVNLPISLPPGAFVTSTATDQAGNTSEFSRCFTPAPGWNQINDSGFGDPQKIAATALEVFQGQLYAGASRGPDGAEIWRFDPNGQWSQVNESGFGTDLRNSAIIDLGVFQGKLYAGVGWGGDNWNDAAGQMWRSSDGQTWESVTVDGFGNDETISITNFIVYKSMFYAGTGGTNETSAQIWRSSTGQPGSWKQVAPDGAGLPGNITGFADYKGILYAAVEPVGGTSASIQVWRSTNGSDWTSVTANGFGDERNVSVGGFAQFDGYLYLGTRNDETGAQLWRTQDGIHWAQIIGDGFGDLNNLKIELLLVYDDLLYAVTYNGATGLQIWRSADGLNWEQAAANGFGDGANFSTLWNSATAEYQGNLVIGTWNTNEGGEVWMYTP
ncbi:MAG: CSLREA domain-containing protein [Anaerolineales bacterium]